MRAVRLLPCTDLEYAEFAGLQIVEYAHQLIRAGEATAEEGIATARARLGDLSGDRLRAAGHAFLVARAENDQALRVGWIWISPAPALLGAGHERTRWLSQLTVEEDHRGRGWGRAMLRAIEAQEAGHGVEEIWLRVFDWNAAARRLYAAQGYELVTQFTTDAHLRKRLSH